MPDIIVNRLVLGVAALNGHIYVAGGDKDTVILSCKYAMGGWVDMDIRGSIEWYNPKTNT